MGVTFFCLYIQGVPLEALKDGLDMMKVIMKVNKDISVEHVSSLISAWKKAGALVKPNGIRSVRLGC